MKYLSLTVQKLWPRLKYFCLRVTARHDKTRCPRTPFRGHKYDIGREQQNLAFISLYGILFTSISVANRSKWKLQIERPSVSYFGSPTLYAGCGKTTTPIQRLEYIKLFLTICQSHICRVVFTYNNLNSFELFCACYEQDQLRMIMVFFWKKYSWLGLLMNLKYLKYVYDYVIYANWKGRFRWIESLFYRFSFKTYYFGSHSC